MSRLRLPLLAAGSVVLVTVGALLLTGSGPAPPGGGEPLPGRVVDGADRAALDTAPVLRGADAPAPDPGVTLTDPEVAVRAYLQAAHSVSAADGGRTHLRAAPYTVPGTAAATVGVLVVDPPPPGAVRTASIRRLDLVAADRADRRRGYLAAVEIRTAPGGDTATFTSSVVVARQPDDRWLVAAETPENPDLSAGED